MSGFFDELVARRHGPPPPAMTEADLVKLLVQIKDLALSPYPLPPNSPRHDPRLLSALGQIAGMASGVIATVTGQPGRPQ